MAYNIDGKSITSFKLDKFYFVFSCFRKAIRIKYIVQPGFFGKHGFQGYFDERFILLDGRLLFLVPFKENQVQQVSVNFKLPQNWTAIVPWKKVGDFYDLTISGNFLFENLEETVLAFGEFNQREREFGSNKIVVCT